MSGVALALWPDFSCAYFSIATGTGSAVMPGISHPASTTTRKTPLLFDSHD
jgi:hypothetical protein